MGSWIRTLNFVPFIVNGLIKGEIGKPSDQYLGLICDESLTCRGLNSNLGYFSSFTFIFVHVENSVCLSRGVQVAGATWRAAMRIVAGVGELVQRIGDSQAQVRYLVAERSGGRDDAVCGLHRAQ
jgi:hypothetical protein